MATAPTPLVPYQDTARRFFYSDDLVDVDVKVVIDFSGNEQAHVCVVWRADEHGEGGEILYPVEPYIQRKWLLLLEYLHAARPGIEWVRYLEPARAQLAPDLAPLSRLQLDKKRRLLSVEDLQTLPPLQWTVDGVMPMGGLAVLYGPSGCGKSFVALDLALSIGGGQKWMGCDTMAGPVLYVVAEGKGGLPQRVKAWREVHDSCDLSGVQFLDQPVNLLDENDVNSLLADLDEMPLPPSLVVFDTLARCLVGGDENSAQDMGLAIAAADRVRQACGGTVLIVHHTGKNGDAERGSSALRGAADAMIAASADDNVVKLSCGKMKDGPEFSPIYMTRVAVGDSCFMAPMSVAADGGLTPKARQILEDLTATFGATGATPAQLIRVTGMPERTVYRSLKSLVECGLAHTEGNGRATRYIGGKA